MTIFKISKINAVFLLNNVLLYMQNIFQCLHLICCRFLCLYMQKQILYRAC